MMGSIQVAFSVIAFTDEAETDFKETLGRERVSWMTNLRCPEALVLANFGSTPPSWFTRRPRANQSESRPNGR